MSDFPLHSISGTGIAIGAGASATVNYHGFNSEQIAAILQGAGVAAQAKIDELAAKLNVTHEAFRGFLRILKEDDVPLEQLAQKLELIAGRYAGMLDRLTALDPEDAEARAYIEEAREILSHAASMADYDRADELIARAEEALEQSPRRAEALEWEAHEAASRLRKSRAAARAERGELSLTRLDYLQAAQHFRTAAGLVAYDLSLKLGYLFRSANTLQTHGDEKGGQCRSGAGDCRLQGSAERMHPRARAA